MIAEQRAQFAQTIPGGPSFSIAHNTGGRVSTGRLVNTYNSGSGSELRVGKYFHVRTAILKPRSCSGRRRAVCRPCKLKCRIAASPAGKSALFAIFRAGSRLGERVVIDGPCPSAGTCSVPVPNSVLVTRRAAGFHARAVDRPAWPVVSEPRRPNLCCSLSGVGAGLDSPPRRIDFATASVLRDANSRLLSNRR